ncbi:sugar phosphate isomerase/epimerase family protein [Paenibacillus hamazuiensis]|uniref:sugar phosphate isomerase/epimerase family protein n=1 Tax=Paenibacillus hamazuiensis TaxID=2936508 RepID=UPI00200D66F4|nr:sugar phosphate isomerase/epimerase family protein [Paenibacillus hamazuiensis]
MKLAFTTLGCPDWNLDTIIAKAKEFGYDGIDFRGLQGELELYRLQEFSAEAEKTRERIAAAGLEVTCFSSSVKLFAGPDEHEKHLEEVRQYARLCGIFGTRYIRVFGGKIGDAGRDEAIAIVTRNARELIAAVRESGGADVTLLLETHDDWTASEHVKAVMESVSDSGLAVLWDTHHPIRTLGENPDTTWQSISRWVQYTHWKDSSLKPAEEGGGFRYRPMGEGDIPLRDIYRLLLASGYDGWFTFEWEKKWHPYIEDAEIAFPHYVRYMRELERGE